MLENTMAGSYGDGTKLKGTIATETHDCISQQAQGRPCSNRPCRGQCTGLLIWECCISKHVLADRAQKAATCPGESHTPRP